MVKGEHEDGLLSAHPPTCLNGVRLTFSLVGQVDQLEDRYLGMVEASGSNPDLSISSVFGGLIPSGIIALGKGLCQRSSVLDFSHRLILTGNPGKGREMYEILQMLALAFTIGLTGALAPGPTLVATINSSLKDGWTAGPKVAAGHALVEVLIFLLIVGGLAAAMQQYSRAISIAGGLALIVFGIMTANESKSATLSTPQGQVIGNAYLAGVITSVANPYFWIWWLSIGSALVLSGLSSGLIIAAVFLIGHWAADFGWLILVSSSLDRGRSILSEKNYRRILGICGGFLVCFGVYFLSGA